MKTHWDTGTRKPAVAARPDGRALALTAPDSRGFPPPGEIPADIPACSTCSDDRPGTPSGGVCALFPYNTHYGNHETAADGPDARIGRPAEDRSPRRR